MTILQLVSAVLVELIANLFVITFFLLAALGLRALILASNRRKMLEFFRLREESNPNITVYMSRLIASAQLQYIKLPEEKSSGQYPPDIQRIADIQADEAKRKDFDKQLESRNIDAASVIEMIEYLRLKQLIEQPAVFDRLPSGIKTWFEWFSPKSQRLSVEYRVSPEDPLQIQKSTIVFIGGPRANPGTFYYLFGKEAGIVRLGRLRSEKNRVVRIKTKETMDLRIDVETMNVGIIQRATIEGQTVVYLMGSGIYGTAAAVAYFRLNWKRIHGDFPGDFALILTCFRQRSNEDYSAYLSRRWSDELWTVEARLT